MKYYAFCDDGEVVYVGEFLDMHDADEYYQKHLYRRVSGKLEEYVAAIWFFDEATLLSLHTKITDAIRSANCIPAKRKD